jgi:hypothetical protein
VNENLIQQGLKAATVRQLLRLILCFSLLDLRISQCLDGFSHFKGILFDGIGEYRL